MPVSAGGTATISHGFLWSEDPDNTSDQLIYTILSGPEHGLILDNDVAATSFTQADIDSGCVQYVENGDAAKGDSFSQSPELLEQVARAARFLGANERYLYDAKPAVVRRSDARGSWVLSVRSGYDTEVRLVRILTFGE